MQSSATVPTANARRYMIQLCKHFGHRVPASFDEREGRIGFEAGEVRLRAADETLMLTAEAGAPEGLARLEGVIESHLKRFAFREPALAVEWRRAPRADPRAQSISFWAR
jgi:hypothetical protein